jgi:hypothetical protein
VGIIESFDFPVVKMEIKHDSIPLKEDGFCWEICDLAQLKFGTDFFLYRDSQRLESNIFTDWNSLVGQFEMELLTKRAGISYVYVILVAYPKILDPPSYTHGLFWVNCVKNYLGITE